MNDLTRYEEIKDQIKTGDYLSWYSYTLLGYSIRVFSPGSNHGSLAIRPKKHGIFENRRFTIEAQSKGIQVRLLSELLRNYKGKVWLYPLKNEFDPKREAVGKWALSKEGVKYDYKSLFKQILASVSVDLKLLFCTEFCYASWWKGGVIEKHGKLLTEMKAPKPSEIPPLGLFKPRILMLDSEFDKVKT